MANNNAELDADAIFEILSNSRRRKMLLYLDDSGGTAKLSTLAREIAKVEEGNTPDEEQYKRVYISLYQSHVPKLQEYGIVSYNPESKELALTDRVAPVLAIFQKQPNQKQWLRYYVVVALIGILFILTFLAINPSDQFVFHLVALIPIVILFALAVLHYLTVLNIESPILKRLVG